MESATPHIHARGGEPRSLVVGGVGKMRLKRCVAWSELTPNEWAGSSLDRCWSWFSAGRCCGASCGLCVGEAMVCGVTGLAKQYGNAGRHRRCAVSDFVRISDSGQAFNTTLNVSAIRSD